MAAGIEKRGDGYRASVWSPRERKLIRKTFPNLAAAKGWRHDATVAVRRGEMRATHRHHPPRRPPNEWLDGAREGRIRTRSGDPYKPSAIRSYERALRLRVLPDLGRDASLT